VRPRAPRLRGSFALTKDAAGDENCIGCKKCERICPSEVITVVTGKKRESPATGQKRGWCDDFTLDLTACIVCELCVQVCPVDAILMCRAPTKPGFEREDLLARPEFASNANRAKHRTALNAELNATLARRARAEWVEMLNRAGVPCGPIYSVDQVFADPQVAHLRAAVEVEHPRLGKFRVLDQAARLSRTPAAIVSATPEIGQHTDEVLAELGYSAADIAALHAKGAV